MCSRGMASECRRQNKTQADSDQLHGTEAGKKRGSVDVALGSSVDVDLGGSVDVELGGFAGVELGGSVDIELGGSVDVELGGSVDFELMQSTGISAYPLECHSPVVHSLSHGRAGTLSLSLKLLH